MSGEQELWQVMVQGQPYDTDLYNLKVWITEGRILPTDKVRKGNLNWIEANRVPILRKVFNGEENPLTQPPTEAPPQYQQTQNQQGQYQQSYNAASNYNAAGAYSGGYSAQAGAPASAGAIVCHNHPQAPAAYMCRMCSATFCESCPKFVGNKMAICQLCGDLCQPYADVVQPATPQYAPVGDSGFGFGDFGRALTYPFKEKFGLISMALMYSFLSLGGIKGQALGYMILFGCLSLTIRNVAQGNMLRSFIPDFSSFSWIDDVISPALLGIGVTIVSWGPLLVLILAIGFGAFGSGESYMEAQQKQIEKEFIPSDKEFADLVNSTESEETRRKLKRIDPRQQLGVGVKDPKKEAEEAEQQAQREMAEIMELAARFLAGGITVVLLGALALFWAVFYYPMALAVAGFTQDFKSVINPFVGIDTIRRMGFDYIKAFFMYIGAEAIGIVLRIIISIPLAALFAIEFFGGMISGFVFGILTFYVSMVTACVLGLALYKNADRLQIST